MKKNFDVSNYSLIEKLLFIFIISKVIKELKAFESREVKIGICSVLTAIEYRYNIILNKKITKKFIELIREYYVFRTRKSIPQGEYWWYKGTYVPSIKIWYNPRYNFLTNLRKEIF